MLQNIYSKYQALLAGLTVENAAVQQLTAAQNQQQREAAEVDRFMLVHRTKTVEDVAEKLMKLKGLPTEFAALEAAHDDSRSKSTVTATGRGGTRHAGQTAGVPQDRV